MDEQTQEPGTPRIEVVTENVPTPKFDFGEGELADKVRALKEELGIGNTSEGAEGEPGGPEQSGQPVTGDSIDWSEFDLDPRLEHFYPKAQVVDTPQGPKWAVTLDEFLTREKRVNPGGKTTRGQRSENGESQYMGDFVTELLAEAPEQGCTEWKLVAFLPGSMTGMIQVLFQRKKQVGLPDPKLVEKQDDSETEKPADEELTKIEAAGAAWAGDPAPDEPYISGVDPAESTEGAVEGAE